MDETARYQQIRRVVDSYLPGVRILLFGSHARGGADLHSDYDLLIITPETLTPKEKIQWSTRLDKALVAAIKAPVDLLLNSEGSKNFVSRFRISLSRTSTPKIRYLKFSINTLNFGYKYLKPLMIFESFIPSKL